MQPLTPWRTLPAPPHSPPPPSVKRHWLPNVQRKALFSEALGKCISLKVSTYALRQMDRMGALPPCPPARQTLRPLEQTNYTRPARSSSPRP